MRQLFSYLSSFTLILLVTKLTFAAPINKKPKKSFHLKNIILLMATTTSTDNSGLLDYLAPKLQQTAHIELKWVSVGSGEALVLGSRCDADVLLVHALTAEKQFMQQNFGMARYPVMYNDFVIVGPASDPAGLRGTNPIRAFQLIKFKLKKFVSRDDHSGTDQKEKELWTAARLRIPRRPNWYIRSGQGMMATLNMASQIGAYTLTDRSTFLKFKKENPNSSLQILSQDPTLLKNPYHVIIVNPKHCPRINLDAAKKFVAWLTSKKTQDLIKNYKIDKQTLFTPDAKPVTFPNAKKKLKLLNFK